MKITHNKIGQNLNIADQPKLEGTEDSKEIGRSGKTRSRGAEGTKNLDQLSEGRAAQIELSSRARDAKRIKELAMAGPEVDMEKVQRFQNMIDQGQYKVDSKAVADRMVDEHARMF